MNNLNHAILEGKVAAKNNDGFLLQMERVYTNPDHEKKTEVTVIDVITTNEVSENDIVRVVGYLTLRDGVIALQSEFMDIKAA